MPNNGTFRPRSTKTYLSTYPFKIPKVHPFKRLVVMQKLICGDSCKGLLWIKCSCYWGACLILFFFVPHGFWIHWLILFSILRFKYGNKNFVFEEQVVLNPLPFLHPLLPILKWNENGILISWISIKRTDGTARFVKEAPDTITSWVITAFSLDTFHGLGVIEQPTKV